MRIAISGAGVAGTALAHWLQRSGHQPTLIERAPQFRTGGYMIDFWGIGYRVARKMGIEQTIRDAGYDVNAVRSLGPDGSTRAELRVDVFRRMVGDDFTSLPRGDLAAAIYRTVEGRVPTLFDDSIAGIDQRPDRVRVIDDAGWQCRRILAAVDDVDDLFFDVVSQIRMDHWSQDRVLLIGDAAGCISLLGGEGTGLAITEAYALAGEIARAGGDHRRAFEAYESLLRPFIAGKQAGAERMLGFFATRTRFGLWFRDVAMRAMNLGRPIAGLFAGTVRDHLDLPDYRLP